MNKSKILVYLMIVISLILCIPSIIYLINNKTVDGFDAYNTYTLEKWTDRTNGLINGIILIGLFVLINIIYLLVIKNEKLIFKSKKQILFFVMIISFLFILILPNLSSDIYYYMGDAWVAAKYGENPYYVSVSDLQTNGLKDEILDNTGYWSWTTTIYGPIWNNIAISLVTLSFGNITIGLFVFKFVAYIIHIANTYLIFKITKSNKYMLVYGLNPLVLIEFLSNVHNDIYLILFILLALYFIIRKKQIVLSILFLAISIGIKFSTIILIPFILIYMFRNEKIFKRILYCILSGIAIIAILILFYLPYFKDFSIFTNMLIQGNKYNQSLLLFLFLHTNETAFTLINKVCIPLYILLYAIVVLTIIFKKEISFRNIIRKYNVLMLLFIFVVLATFQKWYILWLLPTLPWQSKRMRKYILYFTITAMLPSMRYFIFGNDSYVYGNTYSIDVFCFATIAMCIDIIIDYIIRLKKGKELKCQN